MTEARLSFIASISTSTPDSMTGSPENSFLVFEPTTFSWVVWTAGMFLTAEARRSFIASISISTADPNSLSLVVYFLVSGAGMVSSATRSAAVFFMPNSMAASSTTCDRSSYVVPSVEYSAQGCWELPHSATLSITQLRNFSSRIISFLSALYIGAYSRLPFWWCRRMEIKTQDLAEHGPAMRVAIKPFVVKLLASFLATCMHSNSGRFFGDGVPNLAGNLMAAGYQSLPPDNLIFGCSPEMQFIRKCAVKVCPTDIPILIQGDPGTGKEVLAHWIHAHSYCREGPFVKVNCAAIPGPLLESELFGYEKGAFTGAYASKPGRVELANSGTLFLDEITDLDTLLQVKLLQVLQDGRFSRLGDEKERCVNARVICTTNRRIEEAVRSSRFRQDLYYRINVFGVRLLPLSDRREDIPLMANYIFEQLIRRFQREVPPLTPRILQILQKCKWKGNIHELENCIATYVLLGTLQTPEDGELARESGRYRGAYPDG